MSQSFLFFCCFFFSPENYCIDDSTVHAPSPTLELRSPFSPSTPWWWLAWKPPMASNLIFLTFMASAMAALAAAAAAAVRPWGRGEKEEAYRLLSYRVPQVRQGTQKICMSKWMEKKKGTFERVEQWIMSYPIGNRHVHVFSCGDRGYLHSRLSWWWYHTIVMKATPTPWCLTLYIEIFVPSRGRDAVIITTCASRCKHLFVWFIYRSSVWVMLWYYTLKCPMASGVLVGQHLPCGPAVIWAQLRCIYLFIYLFIHPN